MSDLAQLERGYRRLLAWYPGGFRHDHEQEVLAVLMASAADGQRRPRPAESADLIRSALRMRLRPGATPPPGTVFAAVKVMYVGALLELAAWITIVVTPDSIRSAILARNPSYTAAQWHALMRTKILPDEIAAPIVIGMWLLLAWASRRGYAWTRLVLALFFAVSTVSLIAALSQSAAIYAPADLIAGATLWLVELVAMVLIFSKRSNSYYNREPVAAS